MSNFDPNKSIFDPNNRVGLTRQVSPTISDYTRNSVDTQNETQRRGINENDIYNFASQNAAVADPNRFATSIDKEAFEKYGVYVGESNHDIEELKKKRSENQSNLAKLGNSIAQTVVNEIGLGTAIDIADLFDMIGSSIFRIDNSNYSNFISEKLEEYQEDFRNNVAPIYRDESKTITTGGLWDFGWWAGNAPSIMSSLTLMLPSTGITKGVSYLGKGLKISERVNAAAKTRAASQIAKLEKAAEKERKMIQGLPDISNLSKSELNTIKELEKIAEADGIDLMHASNKKWAKLINDSRARKIVDGDVFWKPTEVALAQDRFETGLSAILSRTMENYQEARGVYSQVYDTSLHELTNMSDEDKEKFYKNNPEYIGLDDEYVAKDIASKSADRTFALDYVNTVFDVIQFHGLKNMYKNLGNARETSGYLKSLNKQAAKSLNKTAAIESAENVTKGLTNTEKVVSKLKKTGTKLWDVIKEERGESIEEAINFIAQEEGIHVGNVLLAKDVDNEFDTRLLSYLTNGQLYDSAFWGIMGGVGFHYIGSGFNRLSDKIINKTTLSEDKIREKEINDRIVLHNNFVEQLKLIDNDENPLARNTDGSYQKFNGDELQKDIVRRQVEANYAYQLSLNAMNAGNTNLLISYLEDENVKKAFVDAGVASKTEIDSYINDIVKQIKDVQNSYLNYVNLMDNMGIQTDAARLIASENTQADLAIKNLNIARTQRENNKRVLTNALGDTGIDFSSAQRLYDLRIRLMKLQYLEQRKKELMDNGTYSSSIGVENINKQIESIEEDIRNNHASEIETSFYTYERQRRIIDFDITESDINGKKVKIRRPKYEKDEDVIKRLDEQIEKEGITDENDRTAKIRQLSVAKNNAAKILIDIEKISPELHKEMQELSKLAIQEVLFKSQKAVTQEDIKRKVDIFNATNNEAVKESVKKAYSTILNIMELYDEDQVVDYIDNVKGTVISDLRENELKELDDAIFILKTNVLTRETLVNDLRMSALGIKQRKLNKAKGTENGIPTEEEKETVESPKNDETEEDDGNSSTGGISQASSTQSATTQTTSSTSTNSPSVSTPTATPASATTTSSQQSTQSELIQSSPSVDEQINNARNALQKIVYKIPNNYDDENKPTEEEYYDLVDKAFNDIQSQFNIEEGTRIYNEIDDRRKKFRTSSSYNLLFDSSIPSLGSLIYANSEIPSIIDPSFASDNTNKDVIENYTNRLKTFIESFLKKEDVPEIDGKYMISFESLFRYINEGTNDTQISRMLYENLVDAIRHNINHIADNLIVIDKNEGTDVLKNAEKSIETRVKEIFGDFTAQRVDIENMAPTKAFKNAFDALEIGDNIEIDATQPDELKFYSSKNGVRTQIARAPIPLVQTKSNHLSYSITNKGWLYEVWHDGTRATANVKSAFKIFLGNAKTKNSVSYYLAELITKNYKKGSNQKQALVNAIITHPDFVNNAVNKKLVKLGSPVHNEVIVDHLATLYKYVTYSAGSTIKSRYEALDAWFDNLYNSYVNIVKVHNNPANKLAKVYSLSDGEFLRSVTEDIDASGNVTRNFNDYGVPTERIDPNNFKNVKLGFTYFGESGKVVMSNGVVQEFPCAHGGNTFVGIPNRNGRYSFSRAINRKVSDCKEPQTIGFISAIKSEFKKLIEARYNEPNGSSNEENLFNNINDFVNSLFSEAKTYTGLFTKIVYRTDSSGNIYINSGEKNNKFAIQIFKHSSNGTGKGAMIIRDAVGNQTTYSFYPNKLEQEQEAKALGKNNWSEVTLSERQPIIDKYRKLHVDAIANAFDKLLDNAEFSLSKNLLESDINNNHQTNGIIERLPSGKIRLRVGSFRSQEYDTYSDMMLSNNFLLVDTYMSKEGKNFVTRADSDLVKQRLMIQFGERVEESDEDNETSPVEETPKPNELDKDILDILNADYLQDKGSALADILYEKNLPGIFTKSQLNIIKRLELLPKNIIFAPNRNRRATYFASDAEGYKAGDIVLGQGFVDSLIGNKDKELVPNVADAIKMIIHENLHKRFHEELSETDRTSVLNNIKEIVDIFRTALNNDEVLKKLNWYKQSINSGRNEQDTINILRTHLSNFLFDNRLDNEGKPWSDARRLEEFLVESLTDDVLLDCLNNIELENNEKDTLLRKLFRVFEYIFGIKFNKNSALAKELIGLSKYLNTNTSDTLFVSPKVEDDVDTSKQEPEKEETKKEEPKKTRRPRPSLYGASKPIDIFGGGLDSSVPSMNNMSSVALANMAQPQKQAEISNLIAKGYIQFVCH